MIKKNIELTSSPQSFVGTLSRMTSARGARVWTWSCVTESDVDVAQTATISITQDSSVLPTIHELYTSSIIARQNSKKLLIDD